MKQKRILSLLLALMMVVTLLPTNLVFADIDASIFAGGSGTPTDPYRIATLEQLEKFRDSVNAGNDYDGKYIRLAADIDLSATYGESQNKSWEPIGLMSSDPEPFQGKFDGGGHTISGLYIDDEEAKREGTGLFGFVKNGDITNLAVNGTVKGYRYVGGIVGWFQAKDATATIKNCSFSGTVTGTDTKVGGIAGKGQAISNGKVLIENCYNKANVEGNYSVGGLVGEFGGDIKDCYNTGKISKTANSGNIGTLIGTALWPTNVSNCYSYNSENRTTLDIFCSDKSSNYTCSGCYSNTGGNESIGTVIDTADFAAQNTFTGWDFENVWVMDEEAGRPYLRSNSEVVGTEKYPYLISTALDLEDFRDAVNGGTNYDGKFVRLMNDIDMSDTYDASNPWTPIGIGNNTYGSESKPFKGTFDGDGHEIKGLYVNVNEDRAAGLFGHANSAVIRNLSVAGSVTSTKSYVGGIVGMAGGCTIQNCRNSATVTSNTNEVDGQYVGGIAGDGGTSMIQDCYNDGIINGCQLVGGIVGGSNASDESKLNVKNCYNVGTVTAQQQRNTGKWYVGSVVGISEATMENLYCLDTVKSSEVTYADEEKVIAKTADAFASGEVAYALQGTRDDMVWGQELGKDDTPTLTSDADKAVHKITFATQDNTSYAEKYVNHGKTLAKDDFPDAPTSADGKVFHHWSKTNTAGGDEFDETTTVNEDITVYAVGMEKTGAATGEDAPTDKIKGVKNGEAININLNKFVTGAEGAEWHFTFKLVEGELPEGVTFDETKGVISGQPKKAKYGKVVFDVTNDQIAMMSLDDTGTKLELTFDISFDGSGTETDPYLIEDLSDLEYLRDKVNKGGETFEGKTIKIADDAQIDLPEKYNAEGLSWEAIGNDTTQFAGTFDGNGREIKGLYVNQTPTAESNVYAGLFGYVKEGTVQNLTVSGSVNVSKTATDVDMDIYIGGVAARTEGSGYGVSVRMKNCENKCTIIVPQISGTDHPRYIGGVVGYNYGNAVKGCTNSGAIFVSNVTYAHIGGVVGYDKWAAAKNCTNTAEITGTNVQRGTTVNTSNTTIYHGAVGGVIGDGDYTSEGVDDCLNKGAVRVSNSSVPVGGIAGDISAKVMNCRNEGDISNDAVWGEYAHKTATGGVIGGKTGSGMIVDCSNSGTVSGRDCVGGVVGRLNSDGVTMTRCYNTGAVTYIDNDKEEYGFIGGVVGYASNYKQKIMNCYNTGKITFHDASSYVKVGGVFGRRSYEELGWTVSACYNAGTIERSNSTAHAKTKVGSVFGETGVGQNIECSNLYALDTCLGSLTANDTDYTTLKTADAFTGGEVAWLLQSAQAETDTETGEIIQVWGQNITLGEKDAYPMLTDDPAKEVCKVTFLQTDPDSATVELVPSKEFGTAYTNYCGTVILPTTNPTVEGFTFDHWAKNVIDLNTEFTAQTQVMERDTKVYAVGKEQTETASTAVSTVTVQKGATYTKENSPIDLNDQVQNKSGNAPKNFSFGAVDTSKLLDGLAVTTDGKITGTPTKAGFYEVTIGAENHGLALMSTEGATGTDASYLEFDLTIEVTLEKDTDDAYIISDLGELEYFRDSVNKGNDYKNETVKLTANIDMKAEYLDSDKSWTPIGESSANAFNGTFDGGGHTISGLYISGNGEKEYQALFGYLGADAEVHDLTVNGKVNSGKENVAIIAAYSKGTIANCTAMGYVSGLKNVGGIVGCFEANAGKKIENCRNEAKVIVRAEKDTSGESGGGIVGYGTNGIIRNCCNTGNITGATYHDNYDYEWGSQIGGIAGYGNALTIENCYNSGAVSAISKVGGLVGALENGTVKICYNNGIITLKTQQENVGTVYGGALVGTAGNSAVVEKCIYQTGTADKAIGNDVEGTDLKEKSAEAFAGGEVAYLLEGYAEKADETANKEHTLTWGQKLGGTDADSAPVLTSDTAAKVYPITLAVDKPWADTKSGQNYTIKGTAYGNIGREITLEKPDSTMTDKPERFRDWACWSDQQLVPLEMKYTPKGTKDKVYSLWNTVTFEVSDTEKTYTQGVAQNISFTPYLNGTADSSVADSFQVKYYKFDENEDKLESTTPVNKAKAQGTYLYVISAKDTAADNMYYIDGEYKVTDGNLTLPSDWETTYKNIGIMTITAGTQAQQEPIFFADGAVSMNISDEPITNALTNGNGTAPTVTSSNEKVATVTFANGVATVKAVGKGTATITAKSEKEGTSPVYASFTVTVTKEVITVTANDKTITYGGDFANDGYTVSKAGVTLVEADIKYTTDYTVGDGIGKYDIEVSGLTSDIYDIEYKSGKLKVEPKTLNDDDFVVSAEGKEYDGTTAATVTATVKTASLGASDDVVNVLVSGTFDNANADRDKTVVYEITGLSGKDSSNYKMDSSTIYGETAADITKAKVKVNAPKTTTYVYDGEEKSVNVTATANNGIYFDSFGVTYQPIDAEGAAVGDAVTAPTNRGTYKVVVTLNSDIAGNYEIENVIDAKLTIKSAQQDFFSIEGVSDTVTYGDTGITLQAAGAIAGGTVTYEVLEGKDFADVDAATGAVTIKGAGTVKVKATGKKDNYNDKTATRTFVIQPKTLSVTASATQKVYDGEKDVKGNVSLTLNGVVGSDAVEIDEKGVSATVATADVENGKTVFVNGLALTGAKSANYKLAATSMQTSIDITQKEITAVGMTADKKAYDGTTDATYTITGLTGVIDSDKNFVTVTGTATFADANAGKDKTVTLRDLALSGTKSGNYKLTATSATATATIDQATVSFSFGTLSYVYDGKEKTVSVTATADGKPFTAYEVTYGQDGAKNATAVGEYDIKIALTGENKDNYASDYTGGKKLEIVAADQSAMTITGLPGTVAYGSEFTLYAVGGNSKIATTWSVTKGDDIATIDNAGKVTVKGADKEVTVTATKTDADKNYNDQTTSITFKPTKKAATFKITDLSQTYDGTVKNATITATADVANGVAGISASDYTVTYTDENGKAVAAADLKNAGTYYVDVKANEDSMFTGEQNAVLTVKKGKLATNDITITVANTNAEKNTITYGDQYSVTHNYSGNANDATLTYTGTGLAGESKTQPTKAGTYTAVLTIANPNYENATVSQEFTIAKKTLTATANDQTREYGQNNEPLTVTLTGFVTGEDEKQVLIMPIASTAATSSSDVDTYDITVSGGYAENYDFKYVKGTLKVEAATEGYIEIRNGKTNPYVGDSFKPEAWFNGQKINVTWSMNTDGIVTIAEDGTMNVVGVGRVILTATATSANCKGMTTTFTVDAQKKQITLDQFGTAVQKVYTGETQAIEFTAVNDGVADLTGVTINTSYMMVGNPNNTTPKDVGTYMVMYNIADSRYAGSGTCYLTINKAEVELKVKDAEKTYGEAYTDFGLEWTNAGTLADSIKETVLTEIGGRMTYTCNGAAASAEVNADGYPVTAAPANAETDNVKFTVTDGKLTVKPATLTITVADIEREYGAENPIPEVSYEGFVTIDGVQETTDVLEGTMAFTYKDKATDADITAETAVGTYTDGVQASGVSAKNYAITFADGDVTINPIAVTATAGTSRSTHLTIVFDKALEGLTDANFTVANGEEPVTITEVSASSDNKTYTLKGAFTVGTEYTVTLNLTGTAYAATHVFTNENNVLKVTPSKIYYSGGGGGGGSATTAYTVTFETNGGSAIESVKVTKNQTVTEPAAPTKEGFEFAGWYADKKLTTKYDFATKVTKAMTLYAAWTEKEVEPTPSVPTWTNPFTDVKEGDWFYESVKYANENGMMSGMTETLFAPDEALTRGMLVTVLYRAEGEPAVNRSIPFTDVKADSYYADAVNWAQQNEIVKGVSETEFAPDENITREQIATIMFRYAKYQGVAPEGAWAIRMDYADLADIADYAAEGVMYCTLKGIMQGKDNNMFAPKDNATRAEIAAILGRYIAANK